MLIKTLLICIGFLLPVLSFAKDSTVFVLSNDEIIADEITKEISGDNLIIASGNNISNKDKYDFVVAIGPSSFKKTMGLDNETVVISIFSSKEKYKKISSKYSGKPHTAIYAEPDPVEQLLLISSLYPKNTRVAFIHSIASNSLISRLKILSREFGLKLVPVNYEGHDRRLLYKELKNIEAIITTPDSNIYRRDTIGPLMQYAYRNRIGFIGFSKDFARIGALASIYSNIEGVSDQIRKIITSYNDTGSLIKPTYPEKSKIVINKYIARSFDIYDHGTDELSQLIRENEIFRERKIDFVYDVKNNVEAEEIL